MDAPAAQSNGFVDAKTIGAFAGATAAVFAATGAVGVFVVKGLAVGQDGVDLPALAVRRTLHPELVLPGVAAGSRALVCRSEPGVREPRLLGVDGVGVTDLDAEVVEAAAVAGVSSRTSFSGGSVIAKLA